MRRTWIYDSAIFGVLLLMPFVSPRYYVVVSAFLMLFGFLSIPAQKREGKPNYPVFVRITCLVLLLAQMTFSLTYGPVLHQ